MCIAVFLWQAHPQYPFLLLLNRDEFYSRPTKPLAWWEGGEIVGGRDELAGGTWLASSRDGRLAFLTNFREVHSLPQAKSRGNLPVRFLQGKKNPMEFAVEVVEEADQYNGFNLILTDLCSQTMVYLTNRPKEINIVPIEVSPGIHVLTNARLDSPWPKALRLRKNFNELLDGHGKGEMSIKEMVEKLMMDTIKDDESKLPHVHPHDREYPLSSIFVEAELPQGRYGTRSSSGFIVKQNGEAWFYERHLENEAWKENTVAYCIEQMK